MERRKNRVLFLDMIRGLAVLNMAAYHFLYDLVYIFDIQVGWFSIRKSFVWEQFICFTFILVSGMSFHLSHKPWKNGWKLLGCGLVLSAVTMTVIPTEGIWFGILHFLGSAILITGLIRPALEKIPTAVGLCASLFLFVMTRNVPSGRLGLPGEWGWELPEELYAASFLFWAGLPDVGFRSADYFPVIPWLFLFFIGYFMGRYWIKGSDFLWQRTGLAENSIYLMGDRILGAVGRTALWIYMLHQPVLYGLIYLLH